MDPTTIPLTFEEFVRQLGTGTLIGPLSWSMVWLLQRFAYLERKYAGIASMVIGALFGLLKVYIAGGDPVLWATYGLIMGLVACGAHSMTKNAMEGYQNYRTVFRSPKS